MIVKKNIVKCESRYYKIWINLMRYGMEFAYCNVRVSSLRIIYVARIETGVVSGRASS